MVGAFVIADNTCPYCQYGFQPSRKQREFVTGVQARLARGLLAEGTLVALDVTSDDDLMPRLLAASDVLGTGWYAVDAIVPSPPSA